MLQQPYIRLQFPRCLCDQQADFPVPGVKSERNGLAVFRAQAAMRAEDQKLRIEETIRLPAHSGVLGETEKIAGGFGEKHLGRQRQRSRWSRRACVHAKQAAVICLENGAE